MFANQYNADAQRRVHICFDGRRCLRASSLRLLRYRILNSARHFRLRTFRARAPVVRP